MTPADQAAARRVTYQLETLWDYDYEPTHDELEMLYETAKKNQWNGSTAIDWSRPVGKEGPVLNVQVAFAGTNFFSRLTPEEQREGEVRVSAWRLSQFLHGEHGALVGCRQLGNGGCKARVPRGLHVPGLRRHVRPGRADRLPVDQGRLAGARLGRRRDLARHGRPLADDEGLQQLPVPGEPDAAPAAALDD